MLMAAAFYGRAESWFAVLVAAVADRTYERRLDRPTVRRALLIGMAGSAVAPGRLGEAARAWVVARRLGQPSRSFAVVVGTVISQTFLNLAALGILAVVAVLDAALAQARVEAIAVAALLPTVLMVVISAGPRVLRRLGGLDRNWMRGAATWALDQLLRGREGLAVFRKPLPALHATASQMAAWTLQLAACYATALALGLQDHLNVAAAAAVLLAVNLTSIVPLTPSNVGVFQAACIAVLHPFGVDPSRALAYGLVLQAVEIFDALLLGGPALVREGLRWGELRGQARDRMDRAGSRRGQPVRNIGLATRHRG
jgi:phosphatidylinositol alpha-mannosyltransferase